MTFGIRRTPRPSARPAKVLDWLDQGLNSHSSRYLKQVKPVLKSVDAVTPALQAVGGLSVALGELQKIRETATDNDAAVLTGLNKMYADLSTLAGTLSGIHSGGPRGAIAEAQRLVCVALDIIDKKEPAMTLVERGDTTASPTVVVPTEMLFETMMGLFPAERMAVMAGRADQQGIRLTGSFDVTGTGDDTTPVHVQADNVALARALISMEITGAHFAAWIHSHPGLGPQATEPSSIDRRQYAELVKTYSRDLVAIIVVANRFVRFWGDPITTNRLKVSFSGTGVDPVQGEPHVYHLQQ